MINNHSKNNHNNKNSQINKNNIPGRPAKSNVTAHNEHSVDTRERALEMLIEINERAARLHHRLFFKDKGKEDEALHQKPSSHERLPDKVHGRGAGFSCMQ